MDTKIVIRKQESGLFSLGLDVDNGHAIVSTHDYGLTPGNCIALTVFDFTIGSLKDIRNQLTKSIKEFTS